MSDKYLGMGQDGYEKWYKEMGFSETKQRAKKWTYKDDYRRKQEREEACKQARMPSNWK